MLQTKMVREEFATSNTPDQLTYDCKYENGDWGNYAALIKLLTYLKPSWNLHTPDHGLRPSLKKLTEAIDKYMSEGDNSSTLVKVDI